MLNTVNGLGLWVVDSGEAIDQKWGNEIWQFSCSQLSPSSSLFRSLPFSVYSILSNHFTNPRLLCYDLYLFYEFDDDDDDCMIGSTRVTFPLKRRGSIFPTNTLSNTKPSVSLLPLSPILMATERRRFLSPLTTPKFRSISTNQHLISLLRFY